MNKFGAAKFVFGFVVILGWITVALACVGAVAAVIETGVEMATLTAVGVFGAGITIVAAGQIGNAQIAVAENTGKILELMQAQTNKLPDNTQPVATNTQPVATNTDRVEPTLSRRS